MLKTRSPKENRARYTAPPFGPVGRICFAVVLALALTGCDGGGDNGDPDLAAPSVTGSIENRTLETDDDPVEIGIGDLFGGEELEVSASSSDTGVVSVSIGGTTLTIDPENGGAAVVTVTAKNDAGAASEELDVEVDLPSSPGPPGD